MYSSSLMSLIYFYQLLIHLLIQTNCDAFQSVCRFDIFLYWLLSVFRWSNCLDNYISEQPSELGRNWRQAFLCDTSWRTIAQEDQPLFILLTYHRMPGYCLLHLVDVTQPLKRRLLCYSSWVYIFETDVFVCNVKIVELGLLQ